MELLKLSNCRQKDFSQFKFTDDLYDILDIDKLNFNQYNNFQEALEIIKRTINNKFFDDKIEIIFDIVEDLPFNYKKYLLKKMTNSWILFAFEFSQRFNIDTSFLSLNDFMKWFELANDDIFYKEWFDDFISLYRWKENLNLEIAKLWYINFYYELIEKDILFEKFSDEKMDDLFAKFKNILDTKKDLISKMNYITSSYLFDIVEYIWKNPDRNIEKLKEIIKLSEKEKQELEKLKEKYWKEYYDVQESEIKIIFSSLDLIVKIDYNKKDDIKKNNFQLSVLETKLWLDNNMYDYKIVFLGINGDVRIISFSENNIKMMDGEEVYNNKWEFISRIKEIKNIYDFHLENNNLNYIFFVYKTPLSKDDIENNEQFKQAA